MRKEPIAHPTRPLPTIAATCGAAGSFVIQGVALAFGPLTLVLPLAATDVLFALPLIARRNRRRLTPRDAIGAFLVTAGIIIFLTISPPQAGRSVPSVAIFGPGAPSTRWAGPGLDTPTPAYGQATGVGPYRRAPAATGVTCTANGPGFRISKSGVTLTS